MTESNPLPSIDTPFGSLQLGQSPWIMQDPYSFRTEDLALKTELGEVHLSFHLDVSEKSAIPSGLRCVFAVGKLTPVGDDRPALQLPDGRSVGWLVHAVISDASSPETTSPKSVTLYDFATGTDFKSTRLHDEKLDRRVRGFVKDTIESAFSEDPTFALRIRKAMLAELVAIRDGEIEDAERILAAATAVRDQAKALLDDVDSNLSLAEARPSL
jgi:hypothetical protein